MTSSRSAILLALMMVLAPALGSPTEELLQDTLKSIVVAFFALASAMLFLWDLRHCALRNAEKDKGIGKGKSRSQVQPRLHVHFHGVYLLPLGLMFFALISMAWSHSYLAGAEAVRWFVFSLLLFIGANTFTQTRVTQLMWGVHIGAALASLWTALQFWLDISLFAQGPNPASTFVNRNFFGEFLVCTLPLSALLLTRVRDKTTVYLLAFSLGFNVVALMMTGTRSALAGLLILGALIPCILYFCRKQVVSSGWQRSHAAGLLVVLLGTVMLLGSIKTNNPKLISEYGQVSAIERAASRTVSMTNASEYTAGSFSIRAIMWKTTLRMIQGHPIAGVGAGAWEVNAPLYQTNGGLTETDYYAHNEPLQLIAEYGLVGWLFLLSLLGYLAWSAHATWTSRSEQGPQEAPLRAMALCSLLVLLLVSNAGFPWRMATTGALFALTLAILAASDIRLALYPRLGVRAIHWGPLKSRTAIAFVGLCSLVAMFIAQQAMECESKLVRAVKIAITIQQSGTPRDPRWDASKSEILSLAKAGIAINPHYRKITPFIADALAGWGDWKNATWIWESVLTSRPYVAALLANVARGHLQSGDFQKMQATLDQARRLQPTSALFKSLQVLLWSRTGKEKEAAIYAKEMVREGTTDSDVIRTAYYLGMRLRNPELAIEALELRIRNWPNQAVDGWLMLAKIYEAPEAKDEAKARQSYQSALDAAPVEAKAAVLQQIPAARRATLVRQNHQSH